MRRDGGPTAWQPNDGGNILNFYKILIARDMIGEMWWYLLAGILASVVSISLVSDIRCKYTEKKVKETEEEYFELMGRS